MDQVCVVEGANMYLLGNLSSNATASQDQDPQPIHPPHQPYIATSSPTAPHAGLRLSWHLLLWALLLVGVAALGLWYLGTYFQWFKIASSSISSHTYKPIPDSEIQL